jgi:hypothetical protein
MTRTKSERVAVDIPDEEIDIPRTRQVRRSTVEVFEEPIEETVMVDPEPEQPVDPIQAFLSQIDKTRQLTMKVFLLPNFYKDGKRSIRANERPFVTQFGFTVDDIEDYQQRIQQACPAGGMFQIELREGWQMVKIWEEPISALPGYQANSGGSSQPSYPIIVNPAMQPQAPPQAVMSPAEIMREHMSLAKDLVAMAHDLIPPAPVVNVSSPDNGSQEGNIGDRLIEGVLLKALESGKTPIDKVLEVLRPAKEASWADALVPIGVEFMRSAGPALAQLLSRFAATPPQNALGGPQATFAPQGMLGGVPEPQNAPEGQPEAIAPVSGVQPTPIEQAYLRVVVRMLEDCAEHVSVVPTGVPGVSVASSAEAIVGLVDRFPEQLETTVEALLASEPVQVFELCSLLPPLASPQAQAFIGPLKTNPLALAWVAELQTKAKEFLIFASAEDDQAGEDGDAPNS